MALASPCRRTPSTMPSSVHCIASVPIPKVLQRSSCQRLSKCIVGFGIGALLLRELQPHLPITLRVVAPAFAHLHEQKQVNRLLDHLSDLASRLGADRLDGLAALPKHDLALAFALNIDGLLDSHRAVLALLPARGFDRRLVR